MSFRQRYGVEIVAVVLFAAAALVTHFVPVSSLVPVFINPGPLGPLISYGLGRNACPIGKAYSALLDFNIKEAWKLREQSRLIKETDGLELWQTPLGEFWNPRGNNLFYALAEQSLRNYGDGPYRVKPGDIVLDCGANVGDFIREALSAGAKTVVAIEPVPRNVECLNRTFSREIAAGRVLVVQKAVWNKAGTMKIALHDNSLLDSLTAVGNAQATGYLDVPLITIDALVSELNLPRVDFIKMDIEGAEPEALQGAQRTLVSFRPRMSIATEHSPGEYAEVMKAVLSAGPYGDICGPCRRDGLKFFPEVVFLTPR
jgi:FkbM family methyltransferase